MEWIAIVAGLAIVEYMVFAFRVGMARGKYGIEAPATTGHEIFERHYRVQLNTIEQLIIFLPALWMFGTFTSPTIGAGIGVVFLVGRAIYGVSYVADPTKRGAGFGIGYLANVALVLGSLGGAIRSVL
jgi:glutathione S-transferase